MHRGKTSKQNVHPENMIDIRLCNVIVSEHFCDLIFNLEMSFICLMITFCIIKITVISCYNKNWIFIIRENHYSDKII